MKPDISICITVHNRSKVPYEQDHLYLFPSCIDSIVSAVSDFPHVEIVISDWNSSDMRITEWIHEKLSGIRYTILFCSGTFNRGVGRNTAADNANSDVLFFIDADMLINKSVIAKGLECVDKGHAFFPQCFYYLERSHNKGFWCVGKGNCMVTRDQYLLAGKWPCPPAYTRPYDEDWKFYQSLIVKNVPVQSEREQGFFHQFHPGRSVDIITKRQRHLIENTPLQ